MKHRRRKHQQKNFCEIQVRRRRVHQFKTWINSSSFGIGRHAIAAPILNCESNSLDDE